MKNATIIIGGILLLFNIFLGMMLSVYPTFNCILNSCIIIVNVILQIAVSSMPLKDGFKVSLGWLFPLMCILQLIFGLFAPEHFKDNFCVIAILIIFFLQIISLVSAKIVSQSNN